MAPVVFTFLIRFANREQCRVRLSDKKIDSGSIKQTVTGGIKYKVSNAEQRESNYGWIISANSRERRNLFFPKFQYFSAG
jgi:isopentenyl phosphate kinase